MDPKRETVQSTLAAAPAAAISLVLGDVDLLGEIFLRLGFPTDLVRAAAVCRRWLRAASDPAFLRRFRDLHPPSLLGFYLGIYSALRKRFRVDFVPMLPQPPELAAVLRRGRFGLDTYQSQSTRVMDCRNGVVVANLFRGGDFTYGVHSPLHPARGFVAFPQLPIMKGELTIFREILSQGIGDGLSYFWFLLDYCEKLEKATAYVYKLQDGVWSMQTSATTQISRLNSSVLNTLSIFLVEDKIYMAITTHNILVLDLASSTFSTIKFPDRMLFDGQIMLARASGYGVYLVHVKDLQVCIWLHRGCNGNSMGDWLLVDTINLHDLCANLAISNSTTEDGHDPDVYIHDVGDNAEFVFLEMYGCVLYLDVRSRGLRKVHKATEKNTRVSWIHPFMMTWPPIFRCRNDPVRNN
ncbi:hypothetical protein U9M48_024746 [Paspalum notatum var. saurae]|uniref:F-box domain-containing protein n=1 Tax=Paspalum notatum var. saurae TaxID=547442 RepID=A0AAQ3TNR5_PASNO